MAATIIALLGGVALFLFGMTLMGEGLKKVAGNKMEMVLWKLSNNRVKAVALGTLVTGVIQSSSATSVMVVGFVNSGIMKLTQAISVVMGANIGTSVTGWIVALSSADGGGASKGITSLLTSATISAVIALVGIILRMFCKNPTKKHVGDVLLGLAVLMYGLSAMSSAVAPLKSNPAFTSMMLKFSNPLLAIPVGIIFAAILQSCSSAVGIVQIFSNSMTFSGVFPLVVGISVGASAPVLLSSIGANKNGKRTAWMYLFINLTGMIFIAGIFYILNAIFHFELMDLTMDPWKVAILNTVYRTVTVLFMLPLVNVYEKFLNVLIKDDPKDMEDIEDFERLEDRFLANPSVAIEQSRLALNSMASKAERNLLRAIDITEAFDKPTYDTIQEKEDVIDRYEDKLGTYLLKLTSLELNATQNNEMFRILRTVSDFERIGDHAVNLAENALEIHDKSIVFSDSAQDELAMLQSAVKEIVNLSVQSFINEDLEMAYKVEPLEEMIDFMCDEMKLRHINRIQRGECTLNHGFVFNDMLTNYERVADHCSNIAVAIIELESSMFDTHEYLNSIKKVKDSTFDKYFEEYKEKYQL